MDMQCLFSKVFDYLDLVVTSLHVILTMSDKVLISQLQ